MMHSAILLLSALMFLATFTSASTDNLFLPRDTNFTSFIATDITGINKVLAAASGCGQKPGPCDQNGCHGINIPSAKIAMCTQGQYIGCQCQPTCKSGIKCSDSQCQGKSDSISGSGDCEGGLYVGCKCDSVCGETNGACNSNDCQGINNLRGIPGTCLGGVSKGCYCDSICADHDGPCDSNDCQGTQNGICTTGPSIGCSAPSIGCSKSGHRRWSRAAKRFAN